LGSLKVSKNPVERKRELPGSGRLIYILHYAKISAQARVYGKL